MYFMGIDVGTQGVRCAVADGRGGVAAAKSVAFQTLNVAGTEGLYEQSPAHWRAAATLNDTWGFSAHDHNWKTPEQIVGIHKKLKGMGINYLLNVGPDGLGRIPARSEQILRDAAELMEKYNIAECSEGSVPPDRQGSIPRGMLPCLNLRALVYGNNSANVLDFAHENHFSREL